MPQRWVVGLQGIDPARVTPAQAHAVVSSWVDDGLAGHRTSPKPWAITPVFTFDGVVALEFAALSDAAARTFRRAVRPGVALRLGAQRGEVLAVRLIADEPWAALADGDAARKWAVTFETPTTFRRGSRSSPLPDPESVVRSMSSRWEALAPDGCALRRLGPTDVRSLWVSDIAGRNEVIDIGGTVVSGFLGSVRYRADDDAAARVFGALLRFGRVGGVGAYTARGLGVVRVEER